jgi:hypothetical protein
MTTLRVGLSGAKSQGFISHLIKFGALVGGYPPAARRFSHAWIVIDDHGNLVEAVKRGVRPGNISKYDPDDYVLIDVPMSDADAEQVRAFLANVVEHRWKYGFLTFAACGFSCLSGQIRWLPSFSFAVAQTAICSGLVADALTRAGWIWPKAAAVMMPADLWMALDSRA